MKFDSLNLHQSNLSIRR